VLITAGPTREPIDAVRYIGNRSSGRMGIAMAHAAVARNWPTTLLLGPVDGPAPSFSPEGLAPDSSQPVVLRFQTTDDLLALLQQCWPASDVVIMAAAVADYRPRKPATPGGKISRSCAGLTLELEPTPDLIATMSARRLPSQYIVGFALEPEERLDERANAKLLAKGLDAIVANPLETIGGESIDGRLIFRDGRTVRPTPTTTHARPVSKDLFARWLLDQIALALRDASGSVRSDP